MKVWRVGHSETQFEGFPAGPYACRSEFTAGALDPLYDSGMYGEHCDDDHPSPMWDDALGHINDDEVCGFDSLEALDQWFAGYAKVLDEVGFQAQVYEVPTARVGKFGQALFVRNNAEIIDQFQLNTEPVQLELWKVA